MTYTMDQQTLQALLYLYTGMLDAGSDGYKRYCDIVLRLIGVVTFDDRISDAYAQSPFWTITDDGELKPSLMAEAGALDAALLTQMTQLIASPPSATA